MAILSEEFAQRASAAWNGAREQALRNGHYVINEDEDGRYVLEQPDGKRFEIRWIPGAPRGENYEIVRELPASNAA
jgi:hypothetical protein